MKPTGIVRKVDELGRLVIPKELRVALNMDVGEPIEILSDGKSVVLRHYNPEDACIITGEVSEDNMYLAGGNVVLSKAGAELLMNEMKQRAVEQ